MAEEQSFMDEINKIKRESASRGVRKSITWFSNKIQNINKDHLRRKPSVGQMFIYEYDAKHKSTLPYWDKLPMSMILDENSQYMLGLNWHYLPPKMRAEFLGTLEENFAAGMDEDRRIMASYRALKNMNLNRYKPMIKLYIKNRVQSPFVWIPSDEWSQAVMLPVAVWQGATSSTVYSDSRKKI